MECFVVLEAAATQTACLQVAQTAAETLCCRNKMKRTMAVSTAIILLLKDHL
jgi:hypothetical protein